MFAVYFDALVYETKVRFIEDPWLQKNFLVGIMKAAALYVREYIQDRQEDGIINKDQFLLFLVWSGTRMQALLHLF